MHKSQFYCCSRSTLVNFLYAALLSLAWASPAGALGPEPQSSGGTIHVRVLTDDGTVRLPCTVYLVNASTRSQTRHFADSMGRSTFRQMRPGTYIASARCVGIYFQGRTVRIEKEGEVVTVNLREGESSGAKTVGSKRQSSSPCLFVSPGGSKHEAWPGEIISVPILVQNNCNIPSEFELRIEAPGGNPAVIYEDANSDGRHQEAERPISRTRQLGPRGGNQRLLLRVVVPPTASGSQVMKYVLNVRSPNLKRARGNVEVVVSTRTQ